MRGKKQVRKGKKSAEVLLQLSWARIPAGSVLKTSAGHPVVVHTAGTWNIEAGPDFQNAKIAFGDRVVTGDIEIHTAATDWVMHGHHYDPRYGNVILHVVSEDNSEAASPGVHERLPDIPVLLLKPAPQSSGTAKADLYPKGRCEAVFSRLPNQKLVRLFRHAGMKRMDEKATNFLSEMHSRGVESAFLRSLFEACGYRENREQFLELFSRFSQYGDLAGEDCDAVLWGESGLLPDIASAKLDPEMHRFVSEIWERWWKIRHGASQPIEWSEVSVRPVNSPQRRIAALSLILNRIRPGIMTFANFAKTLHEEGIFIRRALETLQASHPLWDNYYSFSVKAFRRSRVLGASRAADILVNTVMPALKAYSIMTEDSKTANFISNVCPCLPKTQSNRTLDIASLKWFTPPSRRHDIFKDALAQQGAIHIYRNLCEETCIECAMCPLGELLGAS